MFPWDNGLPTEKQAFHNSMSIPNRHQPNLQEPRFMSGFSQQASSTAFGPPLASSEESGLQSSCSTSSRVCRLFNLLRDFFVFFNTLDAGPFY